MESNREAQQLVTYAGEKDNPCLPLETEVSWLIDPGEQTVFVYRPKQEPEVLDEPDEVVVVPSFASELQLTIKELFGWLLV
ncbi:MAG: Uma2 family endonuclease [Leptolyngbya sp. SIO3F4]|nr:Uma2 family endonuclease [Leptolyngbya sp. SIO3F4]